jgi:ribonuclease E
MTKRMLIDATHHEETRVVVMEGNKLVEFDYESQVRRQLKGNIFLAKVTRVEPSLQAAFVNYGGNRHGFLPFAEIHPDYYRIPVADREALLAEQAELEAAAAARELEDDDDLSPDSGDSWDENGDDTTANDDTADAGTADGNEPDINGDEPTDDEGDVADDQAAMAQDLVADETGFVHEDVNLDDAGDDQQTDREPGATTEDESDSDQNNRQGRGRRGWRNGRRPYGRGGRYMGARSNRDEISDDSPAGLHARFRRRYKIQEVIKRGQIMLIQVSKEERGNKGAAVTTYLSLPGRYCVLMPNSPRGGGVSRKIGNFADRRRLKDMLKMLEVPSGMSVILRTAGVERTEAEIKRDYDYLLRLWDNIREMTLQSTAPALIYEEGDLIKRSIRDIYARDVDDLFVAGEQGYNEAREFMNMLMPSHVERVQHYTNDKIPLFQRYQVESQITEIGEPVVQLKSGGYIVINQTEALVAVDVNSGRATKERHIEETALKTNLEAAEEIARQLRLRDLGGLVVIDFIDMEDRRNNGKVERRLKDALESDRARIQVSRISTFGLLELSRQRLNPSLTEAQFQKCPHCHGFGFIRSVDSAAILALRALEEEGVRARTNRVTLHIPNTLALYILNEKRTMLATIEQRYGFKVMISVDEQYAPSGFMVEAMKQEVIETDLDDSQDGDTDEPEASPRPRTRKKPVDMEQALEDMPVDNNPVLADEDSDADDENFNRADVSPEGVDQNDSQPRGRGRYGRRTPGRRPQGQQQQDRPRDSEGRSGNRNDRGGQRRGRGRNNRGPYRGDANPNGNTNDFDANTNRSIEHDSSGSMSGDRPRPERRPASTEVVPQPTPSRIEPTYFVAKRRSSSEGTQPEAAPAPTVTHTPDPSPTPPQDGPKKKGWWGRIGS